MCRPRVVRLASAEIRAAAIRTENGFGAFAHPCPRRFLQCRKNVTKQHRNSTGHLCRVWWCHRCHPYIPALKTWQRAPNPSVSGVVGGNRHNAAPAPRCRGGASPFFKTQWLTNASQGTTSVAHNAIAIESRLACYLRAPAALGHVFGQTSEHRPLPTLDPDSGFGLVGLIRCWAPRTLVLGAEEKVQGLV